jgi:hypothetical protein
MKIDAARNKKDITKAKRDDYRKNNPIKYYLTNAILIGFSLGMIYLMLKK